MDKTPIEILVELVPGLYCSEQLHEKMITPEQALEAMKIFGKQCHNAGYLAAANETGAGYDDYFKELEEKK